MDENYLLEKSNIADELDKNNLIVNNEENNVNQLDKNFEAGFPKSI